MRLAHHKRRSLQNPTIDPEIRTHTRTMASTWRGWHDPGRPRGGTVRTPGGHVTWCSHGCLTSKVALTRLLMGLKRQRRHFRDLVSDL